MALVEDRPELGDDLPPPSSELIMLTIVHHSFLNVLERLERGEIKPRDVRREYLAEAEERWRLTEESLGVIRLRAPKHDRAVAEAFRRARAYWLKSLGLKAVYDGMRRKG